jgi:hypothetical protein
MSPGARIGAATLNWSVSACEPALTEGTILRKYPVNAIRVLVAVRTTVLRVVIAV